jgi:hydrogenase maturation protein HypF
VTGVRQPRPPQPASTIARRIRINGIVQGVGFRPFAYGLAATHGIAGNVANTSAGVIIHAEGTPSAINAFHRDLTEKAPPLSRIIEIAAEPVTPVNHTTFTILASSPGADRATLISPDVSVCDDCLREMFDPTDRRFGYPFINCTNCGPRYTIIMDIPYDRPFTAMKPFRMCPLCRAEYEDPLDRRFHAQPNACPACGPHVWLTDPSGTPIETSDPLQRTLTLLKKGHILAIKGLGGFHLAADAENPAAVGRLRQRKHREEKPFALMSADIDTIRRYADVSEAEADLLASPRRPIVLLKKRAHHPLAEAVAPHNRYFGVMLPYTPLHYRLFRLLNGAPSALTALVMTSGNLSSEPIAIDNAEALRRLSHIADAFLLHNRDIYLRSDDAIVRHTAGAVRSLRRSRGYAPAPVILKNEVPPILACGAELKNTVCLTKGNKAFLSQHVGDLENLSAYDFFAHTVDHLQRILDIAPTAIAHDLHPDYLSTRYALERTDLPNIPVQHHHAHIVACMAEHRLDGPVIGLAFDGTGYGSDGTIWGGEILIAEADRFHRIAHLKPIPMPGAAAAINEPWRMALAYLYDAYGTDLPDLDIPFIKDLSRTKIDVILGMMEKGVNTPLTSSLGRLFDSVAALVGLRDTVTYEGQAAMELEMIAEEMPSRLYEWHWDKNGKEEEGSEETRYRISTVPLIKGIVQDLTEGVAPSEISARFHGTIIRMIAELTAVLGRETALNQVAFSGGVFQNAILLSGLSQALTHSGFEVFSHSEIPTNDGGIALGQALVAAAKMESTP